MGEGIIAAALSTNNPFQGGTKPSQEGQMHYSLGCARKSSDSLLGESVKEGVWVVYWSEGRIEPNLISVGTGHFFRHNVLLERSA